MPDTVDETANLEVDAEPFDEVLGSGDEPGSGARAMRLRHAVDAAGGTTAVAKALGMPLGTLSRYRRGREMKLSALIQLARQTGVRLEWLATGEGPMRAGPAEAAAPAAPAAPPPAAAPARLFGAVRIDRLVQAYEGALATTRGVDKRLTMHLTVVLYDQLTEAAEAADASSDVAKAPQPGPQDRPQG